MAQIIISTEAGPDDRVEIAIDDALTGKSLSRHLALSQVPPDSRALTIAVGVDELLSASWAELALRSSEPVRATPREAHREKTAQAPERPKKREARARTALAILGSAEVDAAGQPRVGADARNEFSLDPDFSITVRFGYQHGFAVSAADGSIQSKAIFIAVGAMRALLERPWAGLEVGAATRFTRTSVNGVPRGGASASAEEFSAASGNAEVHGWLALSGTNSRVRVAIAGECSLGLWFAGATVHDGEQRTPLLRSPLARVGLGLAIQIR